MGRICCYELEQVLEKLQHVFFLFYIRSCNLKETSKRKAIMVCINFVAVFCTLIYYPILYYPLIYVLKGFFFT